jgi:hypothetical protein
MKKALRELLEALAGIAVLIALLALFGGGPAR